MKTDNTSPFNPILAASAVQIPKWLAIEERTWTRTACGPLRKREVNIFVKICLNLVGCTSSIFLYNVGTSTTRLWIQQNMRLKGFRQRTARMQTIRKFGASCQSTCSSPLSKQYWQPHIVADTLLPGHWLPYHFTLSLTESPETHHDALMHILSAAPSAPEWLGLCEPQGLEASIIAMAERWLEHDADRAGELDAGRWWSGRTNVLRLPTKHARESVTGDRHD